MHEPLHRITEDTPADHEPASQAYNEHGGNSL